MSKAHAIYTLLPNGFADPGRTIAKLSMVISIRAATSDNRLGGIQELLDWPAQLQLVEKVKIFVSGRPQPVLADVDTSKVASSALWAKLFTANTPVDLAGGGQVEDIESAGSSALYRPLTETLNAIYARPADGTKSTAQLDQVLAGLTGWAHRNGSRSGSVAAVDATVAELLKPGNLTAAGVAQAAELLRAQGHPEAAAVVPLIPVLQRLGSMHVGNPVPAPQEGPLDRTRTADQADFHQMLGLISAQPELASLFGLRVDLTMPALPPGEHAIRTSGLPWQVVGGRPWSQVRSDPATGRFTMATQAGAPTEIVDGMLDLRADEAGDNRYVVTSMDVIGMTAQLDMLATAVAGGAPPQLPSRRDIGITVAQVDRRATVVQHTLERGKALSAAFGTPEAVGTAKGEPLVEAVDSGADGEAVLYADDVTAGYRVDVRTDGGDWRSLMRRVITYTIGRTEPGSTRPVVLTVEDEGSVDPMVAVQQRDGNGTPYLEIGEDLFAWDGYSLVAPMPGPAVRLEADGSVHTEMPSGQSSATYPLKLAVVAKPGSLPRLRYGRTYQLRVRAMDLAGNSIDPALAGPALVSAPVRYRRQEAVPAPALVPRKPFQAGESLLRLVVRSRDGEPVGGSCERHVAAPAASPKQAELHGHFDAAMGSGSTPAARQRMLAVAALEAGTFNDPSVPDPADPAKRVPAPGVRAAVNADSPAQPTTDLDGLVRGQGLPSGEYVVHDTEDALLPYLGDVLATGTAMAGLTKAPVVVPYEGSWPSRKPSRLVVKPGTTPELMVTTPRSASGRHVIEVVVPPAGTVQATLSSTIDAAGLDVLEIDLPPKGRPAALAGQVPLLTPGQPVQLVHAVQRPLDPLRVIDATVQPRKTGQTTATVTGTFECHPASTARVDVVAGWDEVIDDGRSPLRTERRGTTAGSIVVDSDQSMREWSIVQKLGDTRRYDISYTPVGTTKFREYFPASTPTGDLTRTGPGVVASVPNTARPEAPQVHSAVPVFAWSRKIVNGVLTSERRTAGVRVYLERPWGMTGPGERLGVVVYADPASSDAVVAAKKWSVHDKVSRWGGDSLEGFGTAVPAMAAEYFTDTVELDTQLPVVNLDAGKTARRVVAGHEVHFDAERNQWYADIAVTFPPDVVTYVPMIRLAVVRHQPVSAPGCNVSPVVVTDPISLPPRRILTASMSGPNDVKLQVSGRWRNHTLFQATILPLAGGLSSGSDVLDGPPLFAWGQQVQLSDPQWDTDITVSGSISLLRSGQPAPDYRTGKIVIRELHFGDSLTKYVKDLHTQRLGGGQQVVWMDTFDVADLTG